MIKHLEIQGFKSFISEFIELRTLTLLTGLNSSGKSSVIQALLLLEKASNFEETLLDGHGDISEVRNRFSETLELKATFDDDESIGIIDERTIGSMNFPTVIYISADRFGPETTIPIFVGSNFDLGKKGENLLKCIEFYEDDEVPKIIRHEDSEGDTFGYNLEAWLGVVSPNIKFRKEIQRKSDTSFATFNGHRAKNVGFGLSYTLPVITALLLGSITEDSIVLIENPEAHLHPRGQSEIARLIALCAEAGTQVIIETHSDHLLDAIRVYAKNSTTDFHDLVNIYWFELDEDGNTEAELVNIDENGRLENCPKGLLDQFEINASKLL